MAVGARLRKRPWQSLKNSSLLLLKYLINNCFFHFILKWVMIGKILIFMLESIFVSFSSENGRHSWLLFKRKILKNKSNLTFMVSITETKRHLLFSLESLEFESILVWCFFRKHYSHTFKFCNSRAPKNVYKYFEQKVLWHWEIFCCMYEMSFGGCL